MGEIDILGWIFCAICILVVWWVGLMVLYSSCVPYKRKIDHYLKSPR